MTISRRTLLTTALTLPALAHAKEETQQSSAPATDLLPAKSAFARMPMTYLDAGSTHPMSLAGKAALEEYLRFKTNDGSTPGYSMSAKEEAVMRSMSTLIGAQPDELCFVQSTTMGENLVIQALDLPRAGGRIVTDVLHFFGSFYTYGELGKAGMDVVTLPMTKDGRIDMSRMESAINSRTKLVAISLVSTINGFQHDLKRICDMAHAHGAYVYADIVHAAGTVPVDLRASGVDFAATSSYKWLMGDFGLGFLYVRKEIWERIRRPWWGYHQVSSLRTHVFPYDEAGPNVADYGTAANASGHFAMGTTSWTNVVQLEQSLGWLNRVGIPAIQRWRQPMVDTIQSELRRRGYEPLTPLDSKTSLVAFALKDAREKLAERMKAADVRITISQHRFRISLAVFNDMNDVDKVLSVLPASPPPA